MNLCIGFRMTGLGLIWTGLLLLIMPALSWSADEPYPRYKPSSRSPEALDIRTNAYGASRSAPDALAIGDRAPEFNLPRVGGGSVSLSKMLNSGTVAIIFYRGHW